MHDKGVRVGSVASRQPNHRIPNPILDHHVKPRKAFIQAGIASFASLLLCTHSAEAAIFTWDGDTFDSLAIESTFSLSNNEWVIRHDDTSAGAINSTDACANSVTLTVIPEPNNGLLGGIGLLFLLRRRRQTAA